LQCIHDAFNVFCLFLGYTREGRTGTRKLSDPFAVRVMPQSPYGDINDLAIREVHLVSRLDTNTTPETWRRGARPFDPSRRIADREFQQLLRLRSEWRAAAANALPLDDVDVVRMIVHAA
jgi:hypothetical protein